MGKPSENEETADGEQELQEQEPGKDPAEQLERAEDLDKLNRDGEPPEGIEPGMGRSVEAGGMSKTRKRLRSRKI